MVQRQPLVRHAIGLQAVQFGHAELQRMVTKDIGHRRIDLAAFPFEQVSASRGLEPLVHTYNLTAHDVTTIARFC